ncbi:MAG TPA: glycosyl hydrolase [Phnomibacter sp.]|nr:glycosyl hydrolase [Phnomibacter sp.]
MTIRIAPIYAMIFWCWCPLPAMAQQLWNASNRNATKETVSLHYSLQHFYAGGQVLLGHQDALAYGVGWRYEPGRSDVLEVTGAYPALYGWELGNLELDSTRNLDGVPFDFMRRAIRQGYDSGAVITLSWHANNPLTGKTAWDPVAGTVKGILPGGDRHVLFLSWLDKIAAFIGSLRGPRGEPIPVLFRPWHELTGNWFWWGQNLCTPSEFRQMWQLTVERLQIHHQLNNILWVYNTSDFDNAAHFLDRYPGNESVDVISFDSYMYPTKEGDGSQKYSERVGRSLGTLRHLGDSLHKVPALAETGYEAIPESDWFTKIVRPLMKSNPVSYVLFWRNAGKMPDTQKMHFYVPYAGHGSAVDFRNFANNAPMVNGAALQRKKIYTQ